MSHWDTVSYAKLAAEDPILALPGVDIDSFRTAVLEHADRARVIASYYPRNERGLLVRARIPYMFLLAAAEAERARREFIAAPSALSALRYAYHAYSALRARERDAQYFSHALARNPRDDTVVFVDGTTDTAQLIAAAAALRESSRLASARVSRDVSCLVGGHSCVPDIEIPATSYATQRAASRTEIRARDLIVSILSVLRSFESASLDFLRLSSACSSSEDALSFVWYRNSTSGRIRSIEYVPDLIVHQYTKSASELDEATRAAMKARAISPAIYAWLQEQSIEYLYQPSGNLYFCMESGGAIASASRIIGTLGETIAEGRDSSRRDSPVLHPVMSEADAYARIAQLLEKPSGLRSRREQEMILLWRAGTHGFDEHIRAATIHDAYLVAALERGDSLPVSTLLTMRSYPSLFFLPYNQTIDAHAPEFLRNPERFALERFGVKTFDELAATVDADRLAEALRRDFVAMDMLVEELAPLPH